MIFYNDNDPACIAWLSALIDAGHLPWGIVDDRSVAELSPNDLTGFPQAHFFAGIGGWSYALSLAGWPAGPDAPTVWTGSCPCQPFSVAGRGGGVHDARHLWPVWFPLIRECRPDFVFGEQVAGPAGRAWLDLVSDDLEAAGYAVGAANLCACGVGAPHIRQRLYWVAYREASGWREGHPFGGRRRERIRAAGDRSRSADGGNDLRMEHGDGERLALQRLEQARREHAPAERAEPTSWLELTDGERREGLGLQLPQWGSREPDGEAGRTSAGDGLGDAGSARGGRDSGGVSPTQGTSDSSRFGARRVPDELIPAGAARGFWGDAEWWYCRDGKSRPAEPGSFPLAAGLPGRVGRLRGYGNAIVPQVAAAFIRAVMGQWP